MRGHSQRMTKNNAKSPKKTEKRKVPKSPKSPEKSKKSRKVEKSPEKRKVEKSKSPKKSKSPEKSRKVEAGKLFDFLTFDFFQPSPASNCTAGRELSFCLAPELNSWRRALAGACSASSGTPGCMHGLGIPANVFNSKLHASQGHNGFSLSSNCSLCSVFIRS